MPKIVMNGVILLGMLSCVSLDRTMMYAVNFEYEEAAVATKNLDIRENEEVVGEWNYQPDFLPLHDVPKNLMCFSLETWLEDIKPSLKTASKKHRDQD